MFFTTFPYNSAVPVQQTDPHQYLLPLHNNENNAVPDQYYSSSEGSDVQSCTAPAAADAFISDGSGDSGVVGPQAVDDEPYLPPRSQATAHHSTLHYTLAPDYVHSAPNHSDPRIQYRGYFDRHGSYAPQYHPPRPHYQPQPQTPPQNFAGFWDDSPYKPPGWIPPPLVVQTQNHFARFQNVASNPPPPPPPPHPLIAPQVFHELPSSPSSGDASLASPPGQGYAQHRYAHHAQHHQQQYHQDQHEQLDHAHDPPQSIPPTPSPLQLQVDLHASLSPGPVAEEASPDPAPENNDPQPEPSPSPAAEEPKDEEEEIPRSPQWHQTDRYLRNQIGIPEGTQVNLWALPEPPAGQKPQQPLPILVKLAIHGSDKGMLTLQEIYQTLEERFDYFARLKSTAWKNSIRHNLSLNQVFRSCDRPITEPGKGRYWSVDISKGEGYKRERRRKRRNAAPYNGTRDLPGGIGNQLNSQGESSEGDQDMEDVVPSASGSGTGKVTTTKRIKGAGRRGPYTKITVGQPSIPGTTGFTPVRSSRSPTEGAGAAASTSAPLPIMVHPDTVMPSPPMNPTMNSAIDYTSAPASIQAPNPMHGMGAVPDLSSIVPRAPVQYYQPAYGFTRAAMPTFGQPSLTAPATFNLTSSSRPIAQPHPTHPHAASYMSPGGSTRMGTNPISISSDSEPESDNGRIHQHYDVQMGV